VEVFAYLSRPRRALSRPDEISIAGSGTHAGYRFFIRIKLPRRDSLAGLIDVGDALFVFLRGFRFSPFTGPGFGHVILVIQIISSSISTILNIYVHWNLGYQVNALTNNMYGTLFSLK
jgi:hypothetical protein